MSESPSVPIASTTPLLLRPMTPDGGRPIFDCEEANRAIPRLTALMEDLRNNPTQREAVQRAEALVRQESREIVKLREDQRQRMKQFAKDELLNALLATRTAKASVNRYIQNLAAHPNDSPMAHVANSLQDLEGQILRVQGSMETNIDANVLNVMKGPPRIYDMLAQVGDKAAQAALAAHLGGPLGEASIRAGRFSIAYVALTEQEFDAMRTRGYARDTLEGLKVAERTARDSADAYRANLEDVSRGRAICLGAVSSAQR
jgi:hypothetical protein